MKEVRPRRETATFISNSRSRTVRYFVRAARPGVLHAEVLRAGAGTRPCCSQLH